MCGRFAVDASNPEMAELIASLPPDAFAISTGEVRPTDLALTLALKDGRPTATAMAWGFPLRGKKGVIFNARAETALEKPIFSGALRHHPVIVPTTGFYEWQTKAGSNKKIKFLFMPNDKDILYLAGFWNIFTSACGKPVCHFTLLTTAANAEMLPYHNRMPITLRKNETMDWLTGRKLHGFLERVPAPLTSRQVSGT